MLVIYSLVAKERLFLINFTSFSENFTQISQDVSPLTCRSYKTSIFPRLIGSNWPLITPFTATSGKDLSFLLS